MTELPKKILVRGAGAVLVALCAGCSSPIPYQANHDTLARIEASRSAGDLDAAVRASERFIAENRDAVDPGVLLQRYYAVYLAALAHSNAAAGHPFLDDPVGGGVGVQRRVGAEIAHLVAATSYIQHVYQEQRLHGGQYAPLAGAAGAEVDGQPLVPAEVYTLSENHVGPSGVLEHAQVRELAAMTRLGLTANLGPRAQLLGKDVLDAESVLSTARDEYGLQELELFWLAYGLHTYCRDKDYPDSAMQYARLAWHVIGDVGLETPEHNPRKEMCAWVEENPTLIWIDPESEIAFPNVVTDEDDRPFDAERRYLDFESVPRADYVAPEDRKPTQ